MTDEVQKIREEVARIQLYTQSEVLKQILDYIDKVQEEPVKIKKGCKYRCLSDMVNKDTGNIAFIGDKIYLAPKDNTLVSEENGWLCDTSENASNFELVEEPVSEDLFEASAEYAATGEILANGKEMIDFQKQKAFMAGANWQKEQFEKDYTDLCNGIVTAKGIAVKMAYETGKKDIIGKVRSILNKVAYKNDSLDVNGDYCEQPYAELDNEFKILKED